MSNDVYEDVKIKKPKVVKQADGTDLCLFDLFVERLGVGSAQVVDGAVVGLVTATTLQRYKDLEAAPRPPSPSARTPSKARRRSRRWSDFLNVTS